MRKLETSTPIGLFISDIDGTLVRPDKTLSGATIAAVDRLKSSGLPMSLISARPPSGMIWIAEKLGLDGPFGAFNGGLLFKRDGTVIARHCLHAGVARRLVSLILESGITCWIYADGAWLSSTADDPHSAREILSANMYPVLTADIGARLDRVDKIVAVSDNSALLGGLETRAAAIAGKRATIARSQSYFLDITAIEANKGDGVASIAKAFGQTPDGLVVIGDQANDLPMFARAGLSIAMGQAPEAVRAKALMTTGSNQEDGLADAIDRIILPRVAAGRT